MVHGVEGGVGNGSIPPAPFEPQGGVPRPAKSPTNAPRMMARETGGHAWRPFAPPAPPSAAIAPTCRRARSAGPIGPGRVAGDGLLGPDAVHQGRFLPRPARNHPASRCWPLQAAALPPRLDQPGRRRRHRGGVEPAVHAQCRGHRVVRRVERVHTGRRCGFAPLRLLRPALPLSPPSNKQPRRPPGLSGGGARPAANGVASDGFASNHRAFRPPSAPCAS